MGNEIYFDTVLGGYVKNDVLAKIDAYNALIDRISGMMISDAAINAELLKRSSLIQLSKLATYMKV